MLLSPSLLGRPRMPAASLVAVVLAAALVSGCAGDPGGRAARPADTGSPAPSASSTPAASTTTIPPAVPDTFPLGAGLPAEAGHPRRLRPNEGNAGLVVDPCHWEGPRHVGPIGGVGQDYGARGGPPAFRRLLLTFTSDRRAASYLRQVEREDRDCRRTRAEDGSWWDYSGSRARGAARSPAWLMTWHDHGGAGNPQAVGATVVVRRGRAVLVSDVAFAPGRSLTDALRLGRRTLHRTAPVVRAMRAFG